ncbi:MAG: N-acetyl sugar amidotransferase [Candidatus Omnitrophica bacterium]|nr:N-acetyl sugar amidotransferase [Candidatus Omnitrophota bacterium]
MCGEALETQTETKYGLPKEVIYCKRCVISNQRPQSTVEFKNTSVEKKKTIAFGEDGICDACRYAEYKETKIDWTKRKKELEALCDRYRRDDGYWDCVIPASGGKDSSFTAHTLKYRFGMHPLTVTWAPHEYTERGWQNLQGMIHSGLDNVLINVNGKVHRYLTKLAFLNLGHPFQPFIIGQKFVGPKTALLRDIPLIFYGENQAEYGNAIGENERPTMDPKFFSAEKSDYVDVHLGGVSGADLLKDHGLTKNDLEMYMPPLRKDIDAKGVQVHYLGYYLKWDPQECFYYAAKHTGFQPNSERTEGSYSKYSSIDDKIDVLHYFTTMAKFGIGRATYDAVQEIRNGKITREEGVALVRKYDMEFPQKYFRDCLKYLDITEEVFWETIEKFRSLHLWEKKDGQWVLKYQVF